MKVEKFKSALAESLDDACKACISKIKRAIAGEQIYAVAIFCTSGCTSMGMAVSTLESLKRRDSLLAQSDIQAFVNMMNAAEWGYVNHYSELFYEANHLIDEFYDNLFDGDFEDHKFRPNPSPGELDDFASAIFIEVIVKVLRQLKSVSVLSGQCFEDDLFLGLLFGDPGAGEADMMDEVSSQINSPFWHSNVLRNCDYLRNGLPTT